MEDNNSKPQYTLEGSLGTVAGWKIHKGRSTVTQELQLLFISENMYVESDPIVKAFFERIDKISTKGEVHAKIQGWGLNPNGNIFVNQSISDGKPLIQSKDDARDYDRKAMSILTTVERIHELGLFLEIAAHFSFWKTREGDVESTLLVGKAPLWSLKEGDVYIAPEVIKGAPFSKRTDIYCIGVYIYEYLTGLLPEWSSGKVVLPSARTENIIPNWADEVLIKMLDKDPTNRYANVTEILSDIQKIRLTSSSRELEPVKKQKSISERKEETVKHKKTESTNFIKHILETLGDAFSASIGQGIFIQQILMVALGLILVVFGAFLLKHHTPRIEVVKASGRELADISLAAGDNVQNAINDAKGDVDSATLSLAFNKLSNSNDPLAHSALVNRASTASSPEVRTIAELAVLNRMKRLNFNATSQSLKKWLDSLPKENARPESYQLILQGADPTIPWEGRILAFTKAKETYPKVVQDIAAALIIDTGEPHTVRPLFLQNLSTEYSDADLRDRSVYALLFAHSEYGPLYVDQLSKFVNKISIEDLDWIITRYILNNQIAPKLFIGAVSDAIQLSEIRKTFAHFVKDYPAMPRKIQQALAMASIGKLNTEWIAAIGKWFEPSAEKILTLLLADDISNELKKDVFDYLSGKGLSNELEIALIAWIRETRWDDRYLVAPSLGAIVEHEIVGDQKLIEAIRNLKPYINDRQFADIYLDNKYGFLTKIVVTEYKSELSLPNMLSLLSHEDRDVRIAAINAVSDSNDVSVLRFVIQSFEQERDQDVLDVYKSKFWMLKNR